MSPQGPNLSFSKPPWWVPMHIHKSRASGWNLPPNHKWFCGLLGVNGHVFVGISKPNLPVMKNFWEKPPKPLHWRFEDIWDMLLYHTPLVMWHSAFNNRQPTYRQCKSRQSSYAMLYSDNDFGHADHVAGIQPKFQIRLWAPLYRSQTPRREAHSHKKDSTNNSGMFNWTISIVSRSFLQVPIPGTMSGIPFLWSPRRVPLHLHTGIAYCWSSLSTFAAQVTNHSPSKHLAATCACWWLVAGCSLLLQEPLRTSSKKGPNHNKSEEGNYSGCTTSYIPEPFQTIPQLKPSLDPCTRFMSLARSTTNSQNLKQSHFQKGLVQGSPCKPPKRPWNCLGTSGSLPPTWATALGDLCRAPQRRILFPWPWC